MQFNWCYLVIYILDEQIYLSTVDSFCQCRLL